MRKAWWQEHGAAGHIMSTVWKQSEMNMVLSSLTPFPSGQDPVHGMLLLPVKMNLPPQST